MNHEWATSIEALKSVAALQNPAPLALPQNWRERTSIFLLIRHPELRRIDRLRRNYKRHVADYQKLVDADTKRLNDLLGPNAPPIGSRRLNKRMERYLDGKQKVFEAYKRLDGAFYHGDGSGGFPEALERWQKTSDYQFRARKRGNAVGELARWIESFTARSVPDKLIQHGFRQIYDAKQDVAEARGFRFPWLRSYLGPSQSERLVDVWRSNLSSPPPAPVGRNPSPPAAAAAAPQHPAASDLALQRPQQRVDGVIRKPVPPPPRQRSNSSKRRYGRELPHKPTRERLRNL